MAGTIILLGIIVAVILLAIWPFECEVCGGCGMGCQACDSSEFEN
jgi:hypothetical protein